MTLATGAVLLLALTTQLRPAPWYDPRYAVPLLGIVLGAAMTGVSLGLNTLTTQVSRDRAAIEARLALGAGRFAALRPFIGRSLRSALIPSINTMSSAGIVALPGMMTGQILAGMDPGQAVNYQIFILFLLFGANRAGHRRRRPSRRLAADGCPPPAAPGPPAERPVSRRPIARLAPRRPAHRSRRRAGGAPAHPAAPPARAGRPRCRGPGAGMAAGHRASHAAARRREAVVKAGQPVPSRWHRSASRI